MKFAALLAVLLLAAEVSAQSVIPVGTTLPVELNSSLKSNKAKPGQLIRARIMQDVPLSQSRIRAGAKVIGHVVAVQPATGTARAVISLRFDTVAAGHQRIPVTTSLRALAGMMAVSEAQVPESGPDRGTSEYIWTTDQIGGEVAYGGGMATNGLYVVGHSVPGGVLARVSAKPGTKCRGGVNGNDQPQALWVFSSDACGVYGLPGVRLAHAGRTDPVGEIRLESMKGNVNVRAGSGMLLRIIANKSFISAACDLTN
jgi:hypothetical protein